MNETNKKLILNITSTLLVIALIAAVFLVFDAPLAISLNKASLPLKKGLKTLCYLFSPEIHLVLATILLPLVFRKRHTKMYELLTLLTTSTFVAGIVVKSLKFIVGRARPAAFIKYQVQGFDFMSFESIRHSFPSGHTCIIFVYASIFSLYFPRYKYAAISLAILLSLMRVVVNKHYLSDVLATGILVWYICKGVSSKMRMTFPSQEQQKRFYK